MRKFTRLMMIMMVIALIAGMALMMTACGKSSKSSDADGSSSEPKQEEVPTAEDVIEKVAPPEDFEFAGIWEDSTSQRASMTVIADGSDKYEVEINWGDSAEETTTWAFSGTFDMKGGFLSYEDCQKTITTFKDGGEMKETVEYTGGKGAIMYFDGYLKWEDKEENAGKDCKFEYVGTEEAAD